MAKLTKALCSFLVIAAFCFICIGYASLSDVLVVRGTVEVQPVYDTLVITNVTTVKTTTMNSETHSCIIPTNVESTISGTKGQSVVYRVTVHNYSETETYIYNGILYDDSFIPTLNKINIKVSLDESGEQPLPIAHSTSYANGTPVAPGEEFVFFVTYTLKENMTSERILINYVFDPIKYTVTYLNDNEVWTIDYVVNNEKEYYVRSEGPSASESDGRIFVDWINANAAAVDKYLVGNTNNYTLSAKWDKLYLIMFVDKDGNVLYEEVFSDSSTELSASGQATVNGILAEMNAEAAKEETSVAWSDYTIKNAKADIVVRPLYTYTGNLRFEPVDREGDGIIDYYKVVAVAKLNNPVRIPGTHQGLPVEVVAKLYKNESDFDYGAGIETIYIGEGVLNLDHNSLAYTSSLQEVYLPSTMEYIGKNAFSRNWGDDKKSITIHYNGTMAEWKALVANSHDDWDNGITTKDGSKVMCSDGYFEYNHGFIGIGAKWEEHKY